MYSELCKVYCMELQLCTLSAQTGWPPIVGYSLLLLYHVCGYCPYAAFESYICKIKMRLVWWPNTKSTCYLLLVHINGKTCTGRPSCRSCNIVEQARGKYAVLKTVWRHLTRGDIRNEKISPYNSLSKDEIRTSLEFRIYLSRLFAEAKMLLCYHGLNLGNLACYWPLHCPLALEQHAVAFATFSDSNECVIAH
jgi:hypothetical protein